MKKISIKTEYKKILADIYTLTGIYLRLRDRFRDVVLFESTAFYDGDKSFSFKLPNNKIEKIKITSPDKVPGYVWDSMQKFEFTSIAPKPINAAQGLYGYTSYDAVQFFETINLTKKNYLEVIMKSH